MHFPINKIITSSVISLFIFYWLISFILAMPANPAKKIIIQKAPVLNKYLGGTWSLFAPPHTYDDRLYIIFNNANSQRKDCIEILEDIAYQKRVHAPFNQSYNIKDHLINHYVTEVKRILYQYWAAVMRETPDSGYFFYYKRSAELAKTDKEFSSALTSIRNYCNLVLKERGINIYGQVFKLFITQSPIKPFNELVRASFTPMEVPVFETVLNSADK
jgi:hypothetical protein